MIISTSWLNEYVHPGVPMEEVVLRLVMAGLNHESTHSVGLDTAVELEVTSNRPDCLGHIGVAREVSVLFSTPFHIPQLHLTESNEPAVDSISIAIQSPEQCSFYSARVIRGVRVGTSPQWLLDRLATVGIASVNNIVDITNFVMLECGQPLHAFDLAKIDGGIFIRHAFPGEVFEAINHKSYLLENSMCVIADNSGPVALAGVMGGARTEIGSGTTDILLESARFDPLAVRTAARGLALSSPSSHRFERGPDPQSIDWASRRAASLILELAGGVLFRGAVTAGNLPADLPPVTFRSERILQVLGIDVPIERQTAILTSLGLVREFYAVDGGVDGAMRWRIPSWRRDLSREIDLIEEVGRIVGYDTIDENTSIPSKPVERSRRDTLIRRVDGVLVSAGFLEAMTTSVVSESLSRLESPWTDTESLRIAPALLRGADRLRRSLLPSLLVARATNEAAGQTHAELFEVARCFMSSPEPLPVEPLLVSMVCSGTFLRAKGILEAVLSHLGVLTKIVWRPFSSKLFIPGTAAELLIEGERVGVIGSIAKGVLTTCGLTEPTLGFELRLDLLEKPMDIDCPITRPSDFPSVQRDINLVVDERLAWSEIETVIRCEAGPHFESLCVRQVWRDAQRLGEGKKSILVGLVMRSRTGTLSSDEVRETIDRIVSCCVTRCGASLRA